MKPTPDTMSAEDAYRYYEDKGDEYWMIMNQLINSDYDPDILSGIIETLPMEPAAQIAKSPLSTSMASVAAQKRLIALGESEEDAYKHVEIVQNAPRSSSGDRQVNYFAPDIDVATQGQEARAEGKSAYFATWGRMPKEYNSDLEIRRQNLIKILPQITQAFEDATTEEKYNEYEARKLEEKSVTFYANPQDAIYDMPLSFEEWKETVLESRAHEHLAEYERIKDIDTSDPDVVIRESGGEAALRLVSAATSAIVGLAEGGIRTGIRVSDELIAMAGGESTEEVVSDLVAWVNPDVNTELVAAIFPQPYYEDGKRVSVAGEIDLSLAKHNARGLGLIGGGGDVGQKMDYLFGLQDPTDKKYHIGANFTTGFGTLFGLVEVAVPVTGGIFGGTARVVKFGKITKQYKAAGLLTPEISTAINKAYSAEQLNALKTTIVNPFKYLIAKPLDASAAKLLDVDLGIATFLQRRLGADIKTIDIRNMAIAEFASNTPNVVVSKYFLDVAHRVAGSGVGTASEKLKKLDFNVNKLKAWFKANESAGVGTFDEFKDALNSIGVKLDDDFIKSWGIQLVETEQIAAVRARALGKAAPKELQSLFGSNSPLDVALNSLTSSKGSGASGNIKPMALTGAALDLRAESWLMIQGASKVTRAMKQGSWDLSFIEAVSKTVFASPKAKAEAIVLVKKHIGKTLEGLVDASGNITFTEKSAKHLLDYFLFVDRGTDRLSSIASLPYSPSTKEVLTTLINGTFKEFKFTGRHVDALASDALTLEVAGKGIKNLDIDDSIRAITSTSPSLGKALLAPFRSTDRGGYQAQQYKNLFRAPELRSGRIIKYYQSMQEAASSPKTWSGSALDETATFIRNRLSSGSEEMSYAVRIKKTQINPNTNKKYTQEEAMFSLIVDEYTIAADKARNSILLAKGTTKDGSLYADRQSDFDNLFNDYFTLIFGGQENISPVVLTTAGRAVLDGSALPPSRVGGLMEAMVEASPFLKEARTMFTTFIEAGETQKAWTLMAFVHMNVEGKTLGRILNQADFEKFIVNSDDVNNILLKSGYDDVEQLYRDYRYMRHVPPLYRAKDNTLVFGLLQNQKRSANIVDEGFAGLTDLRGGSAFPTVETLTISTKADAPYRIYLIGTALKSSGITHNISAITSHHTELTKASIELGMYKYMKSQTDIMGSVSAGSWNKVRNDAAKDIIGRPKPRDAVEAKAWDDELIQIQRALNDAYITDVKSPWKNYFDSIQPFFRAESTPESRQGLMKSLQSLFKEMEFVDSGVIAKSVGTGGKVTSLPMIFDEASSLYTDMMNAANLSKKGNQFGDYSGVKPLTAVERAEIPRSELQKISEASVKREAGTLEVIPDEITIPTMDELTEIDEARGFFSWLVQRTAKEAERSGHYDNAHYLQNFGGMLVDGIHLTHRIASKSTRVAKGGVLAGTYIANPIYMAMNELSAPFIIGQTVGFKYSGLVNADASLVVLHANGLAAGKAANVVARSPVTGKVYRIEDVAKIISQNSISRGEASAELSSAAADHFFKWAGQHRRGAPLKAFRKAVKDGKDAEAAILKIINEQPDNVKTILTNGWEVIRRNYLTSNMNIFNQIANASDTRHRVAVFLKAIKEGKSEAQAIKLAQEALFDYNKLTKIERNVINKWIWFWTFSRNAMLTTLKNVIQNPNRAAALGKLSRGMPKKDYDPSEDYNFGRPYLDLVSDPEASRRYAVYGPTLPFASAIQDMSTWLSIATPMFDDTLSFQAGVRESGTNFIVTVAGKGAPWVKTLTGIGLGKSLSFGQVRDLPKYVDPRIIYQLKQNDEVWAVYSSIVKIKAKSPDRITSNHTSFDGLVYELGDMESKKTHYTLMQLALQAGLQRSARDWAPTLYSTKQALGLEEGRENELTSITLDIGSPWYEFFRNLGYIKVQNAPKSSVPDNTREDVNRDVNKIGK